MVSWPAVPLLKPFRALRYDEGTAGPLDDLVAPPHDVITPEARDRLLARSPWNAVRLVRPDDPAEAACELAEWQQRGVLVREERPAVWLLEEEFTGPDDVRRTRRGVVARVRLRPYGDGVVLPHEGTFAAPKEVRLRLLRATRVKPSPIFLLQHGTARRPVGRGDVGGSQLLDGAALGYQYRTSVLQTRPTVVVEATLRLVRSDPETVRARTDAWLRHRGETQPIGPPSSGCVFRNPSADHAGRLIDLAGGKGLQLGGARVSELHANYILNGGDANAADVVGLMHKVSVLVMEKFGVRLEPEIKFLGEFPAQSTP